MPIHFYVIMTLAAVTGCMAVCDTTAVQDCIQDYTARLEQIEQNNELDAAIVLTCPWAKDYRDCLKQHLGACDEVYVAALALIFETYNDTPFDCDVSLDVLPDTVPGEDDTAPGGNDTGTGGDDTGTGGDDAGTGGDDAGTGGDGTGTGGDDTGTDGDDTGGEDASAGGIADDDNQAGDDGGDDSGQDNGNSGSNGDNSGSIIVEAPKLLLLSIVGVWSSIWSLG